MTELSVWTDLLKYLVGPLIAGAAAAFLVPRFQHGTWKKQRRREQQVMLAREWAEFIYAVEHACQLEDMSSETSPPGLNETLNRQDGLLAVVPVLFKDQKTIAAHKHLDSVLNEARTNKWLRKEQVQLNVARYQLLKSMYGEAFSY